MPYNVKIALPTGSTIFSMVDGAQKISAHFSCGELANTKGTISTAQLVLNNDVYEFLAMLEDFRKWFNKPMKVNSFYRQAAYNKAVGGSSNSLHLKGLAMDWGISGHTDQQRENVKNKWEAICKKYGRIGGINFYTNGYHLDAHEDAFGYKSFVFRDYRGKKGDW